MERQRFEWDDVQEPTSEVPACKWAQTVNSEELFHELADMLTDFEYNVSPSEG